MSSYKISQRADEDILSIARYTIDTFGVQQAEIYHTGLHKTFDFLANNPAAARERTEIDPPVRAHRYQSHLIVYEISEYGDVLILRVPHGKTDWLTD